MQITIDPELRRRAERQAEKQGIPFAEFVRRAIARDLGPEPKSQSMADFFDLGSSKERTNIAKDHKRLIAEAIAAGRRRA
jgi:hypothetical protein